MSLRGVATHAARPKYYQQTAFVRVQSHAKRIRNKTRTLVLALIWHSACHVHQEKEAGQQRQSSSRVLNLLANVLLLKVRIHVTLCMGGCFKRNIGLNASKTRNLGRAKKVG